MNKIARFSLVFSIFALSLALPTQASAQSFPKGAVNDHVPLGTAYNSLTGEFLNFQPVKGESKEEQGETGKVHVVTNQSYREVASILDGDLSIDANFPVIQASASAELALSSGSDDFSSNWVYAAITTGRKKVLQPLGTDFGVTLSPAGEMLVEQYPQPPGGQPDVWATQRLQAVGDEFVSEIHYASYLFVTMKVEYLRQEDKLAIEGDLDLSLGGVASASGNLGLETEEEQSSVTITVRAHQFGGDPTGLTSVAPDNIAQCNPADMQPCLDLFNNVVAYAQGAFVDQIADIDNANVVGYKTTRYEDVLGARALRSSIDEITDNSAIIRDLERAYDDQIAARQRASALLGRSSAFLNTYQRRSLTHIARAALDNAAMMQDLINYCRVNIYNNACAIELDNSCKQENGRYSCLEAYNTSVFDLDDTDELSQTRALHSDMFQRSRKYDLGYEAANGISSIATYWGTLQYDDQTGRFTGFRTVKLDGRYRNRAPLTSSLLVKSDTRLDQVDIIREHGFDGSFRIRVYGDDQWLLRSDTTFSMDDPSVLDEAQEVDGHFWYLFEVEEVQRESYWLGMDSNPSNYNDKIGLYFFKPALTPITSTPGLGGTSAPQYWLRCNLDIAKDVNGQDIGWCPTGDGTLQRATTSYCRDRGRRYTWADAFKACEAYNQQHSHETGLLWHLPGMNDYQRLIDRTEIEAGENQASVWLQSMYFRDSRTSGNIDRMKFSAQPTGHTSPGADRNAYPITDLDKYGALWTATEQGSDASIIGFRTDSADVSIDDSAAKSDLMPVRCIGSYVN